MRGWPRVVEVREEDDVRELELFGAAQWIGSSKCPLTSAEVRYISQAKKVSACLDLVENYIRNERGGVRSV
jgi:hypothetical protein